MILYFIFWGFVQFVLFWWKEVLGHYTEYHFPNGGLLVLENRGFIEFISLMTDKQMEGRVLLPFEVSSLVQKAQHITVGSELISYPMNQFRLWFQNSLCWQLSRIVIPERCVVLFVCF
uniref:Uncharacterized protein n=1 Tax=Cacopsylla melanoneura TaxID=428564 RepID=A0A8D8LU78_9HEMI